MPVARDHLGPAVPRRHLLLVGPPGCGKTTALRRAVALLDDIRMAGFLTLETRSRGQRTGFQILTLDGRTAPLARRATGGGHRVGRYAVSVRSFEAVALAALAPSSSIALYVVDEIGRMECLSARFVGRIAEILERETPLAGTVGSGGGFPAVARAHPGVQLVEVTPRERDALPGRVAAWARCQAGAAPGRS